MNLADIAYFLNTVTPEMTPAKWKKFLAAADKREGLVDLFATTVIRVTAFPATGLRGKLKRAERLTLAEAKALRAEIVRDLAYRDKNSDVPFASLVGTLNALELKTVYQCPSIRRYGKPLPGQVILKVGKNRFVPQVYPEATTPKAWLYVTLGAALTNGSLSRLNACLQCRTWFVGKTPRKVFCSTRCHDDFHYNARSESGYFKKYQRKRRGKQKRDFGQW